MTLTKPQTRILVVARPNLGRSIAEALTVAGHEVHRSPQPVNIEALVRSLEPDAVLISVDLPWTDPLALAETLRARPHPAPVLLIGGDGPLPHIESDASPERLRARVGELIKTSRNLVASQKGAPASPRALLRS
jgi:DNA-binding NtrC family response regulator